MIHPPIVPNGLPGVLTESDQGKLIHLRSSRTLLQTAWAGDICAKELANTISDRERVGHTNLASER